MCSETHVTYAECFCTVNIHVVCYEHIQHTKKQLDNKPCPHYTFRKAVGLGRGCEETNPAKCLKLENEEYTFETEALGIDAQEQWEDHWDERRRQSRLEKQAKEKARYAEEEKADNENMDDEEEDRVKKLKLDRGEEKRKFEDVEMEIDKEVVKKQKVDN